MKKIDNITETYWIKDKFLMDIVTTPDSYEAYVYNADYGIKSLMLGLPKDQQDYNKAIELFEYNVMEYIDYYIENYMSE